MAPEYALTGHLTEKVDVFAFGVLVLEILSGKANNFSDESGQNVFLLQWVSLSLIGGGLPWLSLSLTTLVLLSLHSLYI